MSLPRRNTGVKYLSSSQYNVYVTILDPNSGFAADGTPNPPITVATNIHANISPYRSKEIDKAQTRVGQSSYRVVIRYPKTFKVNTGMLIMLRNQTQLIDSIYDFDGQQRELHLFTFVNNDTVGN